MKKNKGFTLIELLAVIVVLAIILIIAIPAIGNVIENSREKTYQNQKGMIENAARLYVGKNPHVLPNEIGGTIEVTLNDLVENNFLESIPKDPRTRELLPDTSVVLITKIGNRNYSYEYIDEEGETLPSLLITKFQSNVGSEGTYELKNVGTSNEATFFVGANPNNWIEFGEEEGTSIMWRIIKVDDEGIKMIYEGKKNESNPPEEDGRITIEGSFTTPWDEGNSNKWEESASLKGKLTTWYNSLTIDSEYIEPINWCLGGSGQGINYPTEQDPTSHFLSTECVDGTYAGGTFLGKTNNATGYGLIRVSDYLSASSAATCTGNYFDGPGSSTVDNGGHCGRITDEAGRTNYLWKSAYNWWTFTARAAASYHVWYVGLAGSVSTNHADFASIGVRPVLNLKSDILFNNGSGTLASPYTVKQ